jgi:hypothetical protein
LWYRAEAADSPEIGMGLTDSVEADIVEIAGIAGIAVAVDGFLYGYFG